MNFLTKSFSEFMGWLPLISLIALFFALKIFYPKIKGMIGEWYVKRELYKLNPDHYLVLNDIMFPSSGNTTATQIDHLVISNYGIFCIETKNYSGWIFGNTQSDYWTQVIYRYKEKIYNPVRQNYAHCKAIEIALGQEFASVPILPIVVFPSADKLKITGPDIVIFWDELLPSIEKYSKNCLSNEKRDFIYNQLISLNITDKEKRKQHIVETQRIKY